MSFSSSTLLEPQFFHILASEKLGKTWKVVVIRAGMSKNGNFYPAEVLKEAANLFENASVNCYGFDPAAFDHIPSELRKEIPTGALLKNVVGWIENVRFDESEDAIVAELKIADSAKWLRDLIRFAWQEGKKEFIGFSIDAGGQCDYVTENGKKVKRITEIDSVEELTVVTNPAAGGKALRLVASMNPQKGAPIMSMDILKALTEFPAKWREGFDFDQVTEEKLPDFLTQVFEANLSRANQELAGITDVRSTLFQEVAKGVATLQSIMSLLAGGKNEEAMKVIREWISGYPKPDANGEDENQESKLYRFLIPATSTAATAQTETSKEGETMTNENKADPSAALQKRLDDLEAKYSAATIESMVKTELAESKLPDAAKKRVLQLFAGKAEATIEQIKEAITEEKNYLASVSSPTVKGFGKAKADVKIEKEQIDKAKHAMFAMLTGQEEVEGVPAYRSLHESYGKVTGFWGTREATARRIMVNMSLALPGTPGEQEAFDAHHKDLRESTFANTPIELREALQTTTWAEVFGDSIRRALQREYALPPFNIWRKVVSDIVPLQDFRTNRRIRVGGFADLATVGELGTYPELTEPGDEEETYAAQKRGNLFAVSWETILADDLGKVRQIPRMLGRAAARTLTKFVLNTNLTDNPTIVSDSVALINATHNNNQSAALTEATLQTAIQQMRKQTELSSGERLFLVPRTLIVPPDLEDTAWELTNSRVKVGTTERETINNSIREQFRIEPLVNPFWTSTVRWVLVADLVNPTIEIGFLGGRQNPEIFVADNQTLSTSVLTSDKITYKIRHAYGGIPLDFRSFAGDLTT